jgi:hypothetical protein
MANDVYRVVKDKNFTVMNNHHLQNTRLGLKAKGLQSLMLSFPDTWEFSIYGLARLIPDGIDSIRTAMRLLEKEGYVIKEQIRSNNGRMSGNKYTIYEVPQMGNIPSPSLDFPATVNPTTEKPTAEKSTTENPTQLNTKLLNKKESNKNQSIPILSNHGMRKERKENTDYFEIIKSNIEYDWLIEAHPTKREMIDEMANLIAETVMSQKANITISSDDFPYEYVKERMLSLRSTHILYALDSLQANTSKVRNIKKYLLAVLFNAPTTIDNYYSALVNHDERFRQGHSPYKPMRKSRKERINNGNRL